jgi:hypothetical protein
MNPNDTIVRAAIHPAIGIARVGNSQDEYFYGPEVSHGGAGPEGGYKDAAGALKRQAARFRIYGFDKHGNVVRELTAEDTDITWTVHVANTKAAWYNFQGPMDIPGALPSARRNPDFPVEDRAGLRIDPGRRTILGRGRSGPEHRFDSGTFLGKPVYLGELRTDEVGRLIFLGGHGVSATPFPHNTIAWYAENRAWHDDISDGPVSADVSLEGRIIPVDPAWVVVAPPNYAPDIVAIRTLYDVLEDSCLQWWVNPPTQVSFVQHVLPILNRFSELQWLNFGFFLQFGWKAPFDFARQEYLAKLASKDARYKELRLQVFNLFRNPNATTLQMTEWPQTYGDDVQMPPKAPLSMLSVTGTQYTRLQKWAAGDFEADWLPGQLAPIRSIDQVPIESQPTTLDQAALHFCLGGPFHPGCEMTWPMRRYTMYYTPFRIRPRDPLQPERDYGEILTPEVALGETGPLYANAPGDITRWMAVPWQADTAGCRSGYDPAYDPYLPTFWPARVPNHVLTWKHYQDAANPELPLPERLKAFASRASWFRGLEGGILAQMQQMVSDFGKAGVVVRKELEPQNSALPPVMFVETGFGYHPDLPPDKNLTTHRLARVRPGKIGQYPGAE